MFLATKIIIWEEGAIYHVTARGNRKEIIFREEQDYRVYLKIVEDNLIYYSDLNYRLLAYCLMSNHVHLIIQTDKEPLTRIMRRINSMYAKYFNKKYNYVGHLFQGKYFAEIIKNDTHLVTVSRYVHLNPVTAEIVKNPYDYKWSSYNMFIGEDEIKLINPEIILDYWGVKSSINKYREFVEKDSCKDIQIEEASISI